MRLSIQETSLGPQTFQDTWRLPKQAGLEGLNLCYSDKADIGALGNLDYPVQSEDMARRHEVAVSGMHLGYLSQAPFLTGEPDTCEEGKRIVRRALEVAGRIGAPVVIVPLDGANGIRTPQSQEAAAACLQELAEDAGEAGVAIAVEGPMSYEQVRDLLTSIDSRQVKLCYDTGEAAAARHDSIGMIRNLGADRIAQVHFKDVNLSVQPPDFWVRLGRGDVRFDAVMFALRSVMYDGWIVLETPPGDKDGQMVALHAEDARGILARGQDAESQEGRAVGHAAS